MKMLQSGNKTLLLESPLVMGILNCNNDSFYAASRSLQVEEIKQKIDKMVSEGADIIDIGGMSTKPGSSLIDADEEISRISEAIQYIKDRHPNTWISVDTVQSKVASFAIQSGVDMINDVSGGCMDENMLSVVGHQDIPFVCTHMQGTPENMQVSPTYDDPVKEIMAYFEERIKACHLAGIRQILIDPGFGFGKSIEHNYQILDHLDAFQQLNQPLLAGFSRKSMIYKLLGIGSEDSLNGTTVLNTIGLMKGAAILRVHDVKEARELVSIFNKMKSA